MNAPHAPPRRAAGRRHRPGVVTLFATAPAGAAPEYAQIEGSGSTWAERDRQQWIADVDANGMQVVYTGGGSSKGRKDFANGSHRLRDLRDPLPGLDPTSRRDADTSNGRALRLPADRRRRHGVHLPAQGRRQAGPQPAAVRRDASPRSSPTRSPTGTTRRSPRTTTAASSRRCRSRRWSAPTAPARRPSSRPGWTSSTRRIWRPYYGRSPG